MNRHTEARMLVLSELNENDRNLAVYKSYIAQSLGVHTNYTFKWNFAEIYCTELEKLFNINESPKGKLLPEVADAVHAVNEASSTAPSGISHSLWVQMLSRAMYWTAGADCTPDMAVDALCNEFPHASVANASRAVHSAVSLREHSLPLAPLF